LLGHKHQPEPRKHPVDAAVGQVDLLGVDDAAFDVIEAALAGPATSRRHHRGREITADEAAGRTESSGGQEAGLAGARRQLQHGLARLRVDLLDEPL
jgi:hypothetical protein